MHSGEQGSSNAEMFGTLLRFYRERAGLSQEALGAKIGFSKSQVAMVERGARPPKGGFITGADKALGAQGALEAAGTKLRFSYLPAWTEEYTEHEAVAVALHNYENHVVPGLLQTDAYARSVFGCHCPPLDDDEIEGRVRTRLTRQDLLRRRPAPIVSFVLELIVLTRPLGGNRTLKEQLLHVLEVAQLRNVEVQVMPPDLRSHSALNGPMFLLESPARDHLAYIEGQSGGIFVTEQPELSNLFARYSLLRAQALSPEESAKLIKQMAEAL
ncbi:MULTISPECIES: helix-turn-helix transcriptional regulator [unclassified Streptomyces]|uniref:helix-turn-helix domain-containing protein n=1 Tax=Streptomyces TaxID=1883 RepID=UPI0001C18956|nr:MULTISPECIES: helix-turn-helix transcriptional regulator [unclassified Streptomyces]AEN11632.1 transcriptional regulator, XRE family [Streptomyces sp. SirexAA-E]PZX40374.1 helix-turn-helix protein [Streptomyces sp. DvalAA-21]RAJ36540.1 helix-turn-helix protein [Streptomyces sp. DpondAA-E10]RAJ50507.1 helix-turn-helix protein [Streptomyces sp. DpondAA-A50]SCD27987.1 Helix-turn-helix domain-containing protein [Streptomyces sp. BpilaLS-43]